MTPKMSLPGTLSPVGDAVLDRGRQAAHRFLDRLEHRHEITGNILITFDNTVYFSPLLRGDLRGRDAVTMAMCRHDISSLYPAFSILTAQALYSAVMETGSKAGLVSQLAQPSRK